MKLTTKDFVIAGAGLVLGTALLLKENPAEKENKTVDVSHTVITNFKNFHVTEESAKTYFVGFEKQQKPQP